MFDYSSDELVGNNISMLMPEPYRNQHDQHLKNYLDTGQSSVMVNGANSGTAARRHNILGELSVGEGSLPESTCSSARCVISLSARQPKRA